MNPAGEHPQVRIALTASGDAAGPVLLYLPGLHGDDTLVGSFRARLGGDVRFLAVTYPTTVNESLAELATAIWATLRDAVQCPVWLLAESFGSQVAWAMLEHVRNEPATTKPVLGLILAGGFVRHPWPNAVAALRWLLSRLPPTVVRGFFHLYPLWARLAYRHAPEVLTSLPQFVARRRRGGDQAALLRRLRLIETADFRETARNTSLPVWQLTGFWDPVVPSWSVRRWLRHHCPGWRQCLTVPGADHVVLATGCAACVAAVRGWMGLKPPSAGRQTP